VDRLTFKFIISWLPFAGIGGAQLLMMALGSYHPVTSDNFPPALVPLFVAHCVAQVAVGTVGAVFSICYPAFSTGRFAAIFCGVQLALWIAYIVAGFLLM
jgi:hypothetical protein